MNRGESIRQGLMAAVAFAAVSRPGLATQLLCAALDQKPHTGSCRYELQSYWRGTAA